MAVSFAKRQRERSRQEKQREKELKKQARKADKIAPVCAPGEDPDLVGIVAGPQPPQEDW